MQVKQDADAYLDSFFFLRLQSERSCEEGFATVRCASSVQVAERFSADFVTLGSGLDLRTGWDLNDAQRAKNVVTFAPRKANFDCWMLEWTRCQDDTHEVDD